MLRNVEPGRTYSSLLTRFREKLLSKRPESFPSQPMTSSFSDDKRDISRFPLYALALTQSKSNRLKTVFSDNYYAYPNTCLASDGRLSGFASDQQRLIDVQHFVQVR